MEQLPIQLDPQSDAILKQKIAIPFVTTAPSGTPSYDGTRYIYKDGGALYWLYVYADGGWRRVQLTTV